MANTADQPFVLKVTVSGTDASTSFPRTMNEITLIADGDCFINLNEAVTASERFLLKANTLFNVHETEATTIHYKADSGTPALYIMATAKP